MIKAFTVLHRTQIPQSRLTTREPLGTDDTMWGSARGEIGTMMVSYFRRVHEWWIRRAWRTVVCAGWDFGRATVQPAGGSHGVALLSHRRGSSTVCARFFPDAHLSCTCTWRRFACMRTWGGGDNEEGTCISPCEANLLFIAPPKIDVTECYRLKNNFYLRESPISTM